MTGGSGAPKVGTNSRGPKTGLEVQDFVGVQEDGKLGCEGLCSADGRLGDRAEAGFGVGGSSAVRY